MNARPNSYMKSTKMEDAARQLILQSVAVDPMPLLSTMAMQEHQIFATCNQMTLASLTWVLITMDMFLISLARYDILLIFSDHYCSSLSLVNFLKIKL